MRLFRRLGLRSVAWSLRRLHCPVPKRALVLEVGGGGNPYPRANVLCDAYEETLERHFAPLVHDRPTVLGFAERLPFRDNAFDFVIAAHVLEHSRDPERFLAELQRVAGAGYIETPNALMERICPYPMHSLEVSVTDDVLEIRKKSGPVQDREVAEMAKQKIADVLPVWIKQNPDRFHVRYYWARDNGGIKYKVINSEYEFDWPAPIGRPPAVRNKSFRDLLVGRLRHLFSQNSRNKKLRLEALLLCPSCKKGGIVINGRSVRCQLCGREYYSTDKGIIDFTR